MVCAAVDGGGKDACQVDIYSAKISNILNINFRVILVDHLLLTAMFKLVLCPGDWDVQDPVIQAFMPMYKPFWNGSLKILHNLHRINDLKALNSNYLIGVDFH